MLLEKLEKKENLTETERNIANYLLDSNHSLKGLTSSKLGEVTFTSQAAVVRLYKKLGLSSYNEFYTTLLEETATRKNYEDIDVKEPIKENMCVEEIADTLAKYYMNEIYNTKLSIDRNIIQRLYNYLRIAKCVQVYGGIGSAYIVKILTSKISSLGICCRSIESLSEFKLKYFQTGKRVAFFISLDEGEDSFLKEMAVQLKKENVYIFGILDNENNTLKDICHDVIFIRNSNIQNLDNMFGAVYVIDIIYSMFLAHYHQK